VIDILLDNNSMNKARAFNPFLCAKTDKLMALIAEVQVQMSGYEFFHQTRKRARRPADQVTYERIVEAILCDLCGVELEPNNDSIHLPLSNKVLRAKSRYKGTALGKTLPDFELHHKTRCPNKQSLWQSLLLASSRKLTRTCITAYCPKRKHLGVCFFATKMKVT
jgi:hypothetical protein